MVIANLRADLRAGLAEQSAAMPRAAGHAVQALALDLADPASAQACAASAIAQLGGLDALLNAGIDLHYRCKEGVCGTCEVKMLAGEIDHRDGVLSPAEHARGDVMMICVSGCKGPALVLDLCGRAAASLAPGRRRLSIVAKAVAQAQHQAARRTGRQKAGAQQR